MLMTFFLHPLFHYNSITEPRAQFLLSLLEGLTIDFPSHFILSLIDVYKDMTTRDKLIFPSAITWTLLHKFVSYPESPYFIVMCAATVRRSEAQLRPKWPRTETSTPLASSTLSTSAYSFSAGGMTFEAIMVQLQRMDARLATLTIELYQVNTYVSRIARQQACLGGFVQFPSPSPEAFEDEDDNGDSGSDANATTDEDASSFGDDEMTAFQ